MQPHMIGQSRFDGTLLALMDQVVQDGRTATGAPFGNLQMMNWKTGCLEIAAEYGFEQKFLTYFARVQAADTTCCGRALQARSQAILEDVEADLMFPQAARIVMRDAGVRSCQSTPLVTSSGAFVGVLSTHFSTVHRPSALEMDKLRSLAGAAANALIQKVACRRSIGEALRTSGEALASSQELLRRIDEKPNSGT